MEMKRLLNNLLCIIICFILIGCTQSDIKKEKQKAEDKGYFIEETCKVEEFINEDASIDLWKDEAEKLQAAIKNEEGEDYMCIQEENWKKSNYEICIVSNQKEEQIESMNKIQVQQDENYENMQTVSKETIVKVVAELIVNTIQIVQLTFRTLY